MNRINPDKLLLSKWTAVDPVHKERHFVVSKVIRDDDDTIIACELEAVINKKVYEMAWQQLKNSNRWIMGWK
jgi:tryptophan-rich hypothetical protein